MNENKFNSKTTAVPQGSAVAGRNAVLELLASGRSVEKIYLQKDGTGASKKILALAKERKIPLSFADKKKLDFLKNGDYKSLRRKLDEPNVKLPDDSSEFELKTALLQHMLKNEK